MQATLTRIRLRSFVIVAIIGSAAVVTLINYLLFRVRGTPSGGGMIAHLSTVNAGFNLISTICLLSAYAAIRKRNVEAHRKRMGLAFLSSAFFLVGYLVYHAFHGETKFTGEGAIRLVYFFILITHVLLSAVVVPLILVTFFLALRGDYARHKKLVRYTFPIWLYVSVTGIVVWAMLKATGS